MGVRNEGRGRRFNPGHRLTENLLHWCSKFMDIKLLSQKFCDYSTHIRGYSPYTTKRYQVVIDYYCKWSGVTDIEKVAKESVREFFFYGRVERKWGTNTFIVFHKSLVVFFRWCIQEGRMSSNPAEDVEVPRLEKRIPPKLNKQEALKLLEVVYNYPYDYKFLRYRNHALFSVFLFAGLRKQEVIKLRLTDVDFENMSIFVHQGKGAKDRIVPMSFTLAQTLKKYIEERRRLGKTCSEFFTSLNRNAGFTSEGLKRIVVQVRDASGIKFTIHKLRHTFATLMLEGGCDIYSLSRMMGHSNITTTTIYLAASAEHLRSEMKKHPLNDFA